MIDHLLALLKLNALMLSHQHNSIASGNGRKILTSLRFCGKRLIFHYLQYKKVINSSSKFRNRHKHRHLLERTMAALTCNDTIEYIMKAIDFLRKVKHIRPKTEKIYNSIRKELNDESE